MPEWVSVCWRLCNSTQLLCDIRVYAWPSTKQQQASVDTSNDPHDTAISCATTLWAIICEIRLALLPVAASHWKHRQRARVAVRVRTSMITQQRNTCKLQGWVIRTSETLNMVHTSTFYYWLYYYYVKSHISIVYNEGQIIDSYIQACLAFSINADILLPSWNWLTYMLRIGSVATGDGNQIVNGIKDDTRQN